MLYKEVLKSFYDILDTKMKNFKYSLPMIAVLIRNNFNFTRF